jgi:phosphate transport system substrate-binding protein
MYVVVVGLYQEPAREVNRFLFAASYHESKPHDFPLLLAIRHGAFGQWYHVDMRGVCMKIGNRIHRVWQEANLWRRMTAFLVVGLLVLPCEAPALTGRIVIAGYGPEQPMMQDLARAYEKLHPGTAIDFEWEKTVRAAKMVKDGDAQIAVTDQPDASLSTVTVAWDGIAVIVNFANPLTELTSEQVRGLFSGSIRRWSEVEGADRPVEVIRRAAKDNLTSGLETSLGLTGKLVDGVAARSDQQTLRLVSGRDAAVSYISLTAALKAQEDGIPIRMVSIVHIEPGEPTVASGAYRLRRPVLLLTANKPGPLTESFLNFVQSTDNRPVIRTMYVPVEPASSASFRPSLRQATDTKPAP